MYRKVAVRDPDHNKFYLVRLTERQVKRLNNGALVSLGLTVGANGFTRKEFDRLPKTEISYDEWNHSGCQSSCIRRGHSTCRW